MQEGLDALDIRQRRGAVRNREDKPRRAMQRSLLVLLALVLGLLAAATVDGQEVPTHRFYGLKGDVTIDGQPLEPGETIIAWHGDREIGRTTVLADGSWLIDVQVEQFPDRCSVRFSVQSVVGTHSWTNCNLRVKMAFEDGKQVEPDPPSVEDEDDSTDEADDEAEPVEEDDQPADEDVELDEDPAAPEDDQSADEDVELDEDPAEPEDDQSAEDEDDQPADEDVELNEDPAASEDDQAAEDEDDQPADEDVELNEDPAASEDDQAAEDEEERSEDSQEEETDEPAQPERVTPKAPKTGSGGLLARGTGVASWVSAAAAVALSALLFAYRRRRSQGGERGNSRR